VIIRRFGPIIYWIARGIVVVMDAGHMKILFCIWVKKAQWFIAVALSMPCLVFEVLVFFVLSSSGLSSFNMPIMAAIGLIFLAWAVNWW